MKGDPQHLYLRMATISPSGSVWPHCQFWEKPLTFDAQESWVPFYRLQYIRDSASSYVSMGEIPPLCCALSSDFPMLMALAPDNNGSYLDLPLLHYVKDSPLKTNQQFFSKYVFVNCENIYNQ
jgi:hypothetical protein